MQTDIGSASLLTQSKVRALCGDVSAMSIYRWRHNPEMSFPQPLTINKRLYWREREVLDWLNAQEVQDARAA